MRTVYMPRGCDEEAFRDTPEAWRDFLTTNRLLSDDGSAEFLVADILGSADVMLEKDGAVPVAPDGTNYVTVWLDGEISDMADSVDAVVKNMRECMADYDWPLDLMFVFWRHHQKAVRLKLAA